MTTVPCNGAEQDIHVTLYVREQNVSSIYLHSRMRIQLRVANVVVQSIQSTLILPNDISWDEGGIARMHASSSSSFLFIIESRSAKVLVGELLLTRTNTASIWCRPMARACAMSCSAGKHLQRLNRIEYSKYQRIQTQTLIVNCNRDIENSTMPKSREPVYSEAGFDSECVALETGNNSLLTCKTRVDLRKHDFQIQVTRIHFKRKTIN